MLVAIRALVATKVRVLVLVAVSLLIVGRVGLAVLGAPSLAGMQNSFGDVDDEPTAIETELVIHNPNPFGIGVEDLAVDYTVRMNRLDMAVGDLDGVAIGSGNSRVFLESTLGNEAIGEWWTSHIAAGEVTDVEIDLIVTLDRFDRGFEHTHETTVETEILEAFNSEETREVNAERSLVDDPVLYINETIAAWGSVTESTTEIEMQSLVYNPDLTPYVITRMGYEITMNDVRVGAGETHREHVIEGHGHEHIPLTAGIDASALDAWWVTHLDEDVWGHQVSELRIDFHAIIELPGGEQVHVDLDELTYEEISSPLISSRKVGMSANRLVHLTNSRNTVIGTPTMRT